MLTSKKCISGKVLFSSVAESCICLYPAEESRLSVECTKYPVQFTLFTQLDISGSRGKLKVPYEEAIREYEQMKAVFQLKKDFTAIIEGMEFSIPMPKVFSFSEDDLVVLLGSKIVLRDEKDRDIRRMAFEHVTMLTGNSSFSFALGKASELGREQAERDTIRLMTSSAFFREVFAYDKLKPIAEDIQSKYSRLQKDPDFRYPFPLFKRDVRNLQQRAAELGLDVRYVESLLRDPSIGPNDGYLLWYYKNRASFMFQWAFVNTILLLLIAAFLATRRWVTRTNWKAARSVVALIKSSIILGINGYIFSQKPESLHLKYMVIPGLLLLACLTLSLWATSESKPGNAAGGCDLPSS